MTDASIGDDAQDFLRELSDMQVADVRHSMPSCYASDRPLLPVVEEWAIRVNAGTAGNLILTGPTGAGKTTTAWSVLLRVCELGWRGRWRFDYFDDLTASLRAGGDIEFVVEDRSTAGLLVVDDLATSPLTEWQITQLGRIVHHRWEQHRPMVVTSNQPRLRDLLGERVASRLQHAATVVTLGGADRRRTS